ncbi:hypothetical protein B0H13DRAFT_2019146 [Mycena leptocephala]|nr:hypothetical protein B0H13DRAFT_2019146 [Mycena leptocephala]
MPPSFKFALGPLSNREPEYQKQNSLVVDRHGRLRYAALSRRALALPLEILAEIFLHSLPDVDFVTPDLAATPLVLCGVCHQWREVAISTPRLWSSLVFDVQLATRANAYVDLYRRWLSRARKAPLSLYLQHPDGQDASEPVCLLLQTIAGLSSQWRNIDLDLGRDVAKILFSLNVAEAAPPDESPQREGSRSPKSFPLLEKLAVGAHTSFLESDLSISLDAPRLREVFVPIYLPQIHFPWVQITTFRTDDIRLSPCLEILTNATNLVNGTLEIRDDASIVPPSILSLNRLQSLTLAGMLVMDADRIPMIILNCLKAPALKNLTLQFAYFYGSHAWSHSWDVSPFLSFVSRSSFQLQSLALSLMPTTTEILIECLKAIPSLVHLKLEPPRFVNMNTVFTQLIGNSDFLPKLESLHMFFSIHTGMHSITSSVVVEMLCWRWAGVGVTRLKSFQMAQSSFRLVMFDEAAQSELQRLEEEGLELYVGKPRPGIDSFGISTGFNFLL